ncbi:MAG: NAD-dependent epimerase/dehydratase family protein, partial [Gemmatimonadaceae bacterium]|nr:NAD-dependent epimerase/dehydratase family protein [Gemmatimonadaceae bacterium]
MQRALVTGAGGFVGQHLCRALVARGVHVVGATLGGAPERATGSLTAVEWIDADLRDAERVAQVVERGRPDAVYHLAGVALISAAADRPLETLQTNVGVSALLLRQLASARRAETCDARVLLIGSAQVYGRVETDAPISEPTPCRPRSFYAASKLAQEAFGLEAWYGAGVPVVLARPFNHSGRGQSPTFLLPGLIGRLERARRDGRIAIGNPSPVREYLHVEDVVEAYITLIERGQPGEAYNIATGNGVTVEGLVREVLAAAGVDARCETDPALVRPVDVPYLVGDG